MNNTNDICTVDFPVIMFSPKYPPVRYKTIKSISYFSYNLFIHFDPVGSFIINSLGLKYSVVSISTKNQYSILKRSILSLLNIKIEVKFELEKPISISLKELKESLNNELANNLDYWWCKGDPKELRYKINRCNSIKELFHLPFISTYN